MDERLTEIEDWAKAGQTSSDNPVDRPQFTNIDAFRAYVCNYLRNRQDLHQEGMTMLVRQLAPGPSGMPLEVYVFTKTVEWAEADIFSHLVAAIPEFDLRIFQEPAGIDFQALGAQCH